MAEYLIFEYEYIKIWIRIYSNIQTNEKLRYEYIRIFVNFLQIYSNFIHVKKSRSHSNKILKQKDHTPKKKAPKIFDHISVEIKPMFYGIFDYSTILIAKYWS